MPGQQAEVVGGVAEARTAFEIDHAEAARAEPKVPGVQVQVQSETSGRRRAGPGQPLQCQRDPIADRGVADVGGRQRQHRAPVRAIGLGLAPERPRRRQRVQSRQPVAGGPRRFGLEAPAAQRFQQGRAAGTDFAQDQGARGAIEQ